MIHFDNMVKILHWYWANKMRNFNLYFLSWPQLHMQLIWLQNKTNFHVGHFENGPSPIGCHILCFIFWRLMPSK